MAHPVYIYTYIYGWVILKTQRETKANRQQNREGRKEGRWRKKGEELEGKGKHCCKEGGLSDATSVVSVIVYVRKLVYL